MAKKPKPVIVSAKQLELGKTYRTCFGKESRGPAFKIIEITEDNGYIWKRVGTEITGEQSGFARKMSSILYEEVTDEVL